MAKHKDEDRQRGLTGETDPQRIKDTTDRIDQQELEARDQLNAERNQQS